jgi:hypothetical protein
MSTEIMRLINLIDTFNEHFRPELPPIWKVSEKDFVFDNPEEENFVLDRIYLCAGNLEALRKIAPYHYKGAREVWYKSSGERNGPCKPVRLNLQTKEYETATLEEITQVQRLLKIGLLIRGANAGVFYKNYLRRGYLHAEAVPARVIVPENLSKHIKFGPVYL